MKKIALASALLASVSTFASADGINEAPLGEDLLTPISLTEGGESSVGRLIAVGGFSTIKGSASHITQSGDLSFEAEGVAVAVGTLITENTGLHVEHFRASQANINNSGGYRAEMDFNTTYIGMSHTFDEPIMLTETTPLLLDAGLGYQLTEMKVDGVGHDDHDVFITSTARIPFANNKGAAGIGVHYNIIDANTNYSLSALYKISDTTALGVTYSTSDLDNDRTQINADNLTIGVGYYF